MSSNNPQLPALSSQLYESAHALIHLGDDGSPIYADRFRQLNTKVLQLLNELYPLKGSSYEEETEICLALLMGFSSTIYCLEGQEEKMQVLLDRAHAVVQKLEPSLLKCQLLLYCYAEVQDKALMEEAKEIIMSWGGRELTDGEMEMMGKYNAMVIT